MAKKIASIRLAMAWPLGLVVAALCGKAPAQGPEAQPAEAFQPTQRYRCTGWLPIYTDWSAPVSGENPAKPDALTVEIDRTIGIVHWALPQVGALSAELGSNPKFYMAESHVERLLLGRTVSVVSLRINRATGETFAVYRLDDGNPVPAFRGACQAVED